MAAAINYREQYARYKRYFKWLRESYGTKPAVKASLELLFTLLTISFFALFAIRPTATTIGQLFANIKTQQEIAVKLEQKLKDLETAQNVFRQEERGLILLDQALPVESDPAGLLQQIEALSGSYNATLLSFSIEGAPILGSQKTVEGKDEQTAGADKVKVSFSVSGSYESLIALLTDTENLRRVIKIDTISFSQGKGKNSGKLILAITGKSYYYKVGGIKK